MPPPSDLLMNYRFISRLLSLILAALAAAFLLCLGIALLHRSDPGESAAIVGFQASTAVALILAAVFYLLSRGAEPRILRKEALCLVGVGWILASLVGALPYVLILEDCRVSDAVFESASGVTTTGASVFTGFEKWPRSLLFWRQMSQWIGGIGVVVFFVAILGFLGAGGKILFTNESSAKTADFHQGRVQSVVARLFFLYLGLSAGCCAGLLLAGMNLYDAVCHTFTTVSTAGFSTRSDSIAAFASPGIEWVMIVFMILGSISFFFHLLILRAQWRPARQNTEVLAYLAILIFATALTAGVLFVSGERDGIHDTIRTAAFQVVSIASTSGFGTADFDQWPVFTRALLLALMTMGGCAASTAGGAKVIRIVVAAKICVTHVEKSFRSRVVRPVIANGKPLDPDTRENILIYLTLLALLAISSIVVFTLLEPGLSLEGSISSVVSCFFNIGPGFAEVGPTENYAMVSAPGKILLSLLMIMGRIELFGILVLFSPLLWKKLS